MYLKNKLQKEKTTGTSGKKKNTYIVDLHNSLSHLSIFEYCDNTPLPLVSINGQAVQGTNTGWSKCKNFENPGAYEMVVEYNELLPYMGKIANTIVEYLDKDSNMPIAYLYPSALYACHKDFEARLNRASRRDLQYQQNLREQMIAEYLRHKQEKQK